MMRRNSRMPKKYGSPVKVPYGVPALIASETGYKVGTIRAMLQGDRSRPAVVEERLAHYLKYTTTHN